MKEFSDKEIETLANNVEKMGTAMAGASGSILMSILKKYWWLIAIQLTIGISLVALAIWGIVSVFS